MDDGYEVVAPCDGQEVRESEEALEAQADAIVLITSHNRVETTQRCLEALSQQSGVDFDVVLNDDGSSDGTARMASSYDFVRVVQGSGHDYWAGGMRRAWRLAGVDRYRVTVLLNDDVVLRDGALARLVDMAATDGRNLYGGAVVRSLDGTVSYGGYSSSTRLRRLRMRMVQPGMRPTPCDVLNGNFMAIPRRTALALGGLSPRFQHGMADFELCHRAARLGARCYLLPGAWGDCDDNNLVGTWHDSQLSRKNRWAHLRSPTGLPPREYLYYCKNFGGPMWPLDFASPYFRILMGKGGSRVRRDDAA